MSESVLQMQRRGPHVAIAGVAYASTQLLAGTVAGRFGCIVDFQRT